MALQERERKTKKKLGAKRAAKKVKKSKEENFRPAPSGFAPGALEKESKMHTRVLQEVEEWCRMYPERHEQNLLELQSHVRSTFLATQTGYVPFKDVKSTLAPLEPVTTADKEIAEDEVVEIVEEIKRIKTEEEQRYSDSVSRSPKDTGIEPESSEEKRTYTRKRSISYDMYRKRKEISSILDGA